MTAVEMTPCKSILFAAAAAVNRELARYIDQVLDCFCVQSNIATIVSTSQGPSFKTLLGRSFQQIRNDPALMAIAQDNGYPSVDAMIPGISAFEDAVRMSWQCGVTFMHQLLIKGQSVNTCSAC
jgi:hypothetical protein